MSHTIKYQVYPTPKKDDDEVQTYHVRHSATRCVHTDELVEHIAEHTMLNIGVMEHVMETLKREIVEHLLDNKDVHLDGIGRFSLALSTKRVQDEEDGPWHRKTYTDADALTAREVVISGMTFVPDQKMLKRLQEKAVSFERIRIDYQQEVPRATLLKTLAEYCERHGSFTRNKFQQLFGVSRYRAKQMLDELVNEAYPKYYRVKAGTSWVYRKWGT